MCEGCSYWHGDYHLDMLGRDVAKIERDIERKRGIIQIRESYKAANEGYPQRTAAIKRDLELDEDTLAKVREHILEHEPQRISERRPRNSQSENKNSRRNRGHK